KKLDQNKKIDLTNFTDKETIEKNKHIIVEKKVRNKTASKDSSVLNFFKNSTFVRIGNHGETLFYECKTKEAMKSIPQTIPRYRDFVGKLKFFKFYSGNKFYVFFDQCEELKTYLKQNKIELNITNVYETSEFAFFTDSINEKETSSKPNRQKFELFRYFLNLVTVSQKSEWIRDKNREDVCTIYFSDEVLRYNPLISFYFKMTFNKFLSGYMHDASIVQRNKFYAKIKNFESLVKVFEELKIEIPEIHAYESRIEKNVKPKLLRHINKQILPDIPHKEISPFPKISYQEYNRLCNEIKNRLPVNLQETFQLNPKTVFYLNNDDDILKLNATISVLQNTSFTYKKQQSFEENFYIGFVQKLSIYGMELGVFAAKNMIFNAHDVLCQYPGVFTTIKPDNMTYVYEFNDGYLVPDPTLGFNFIPWMNSGSSLYLAHIQAIMDPENSHRINIVASPLCGEKVEIKKDEQFLNFYGSDYFSITLQQKKIERIPVNKLDGVTPFKEEFNKLKLKENYINRDEFPEMPQRVLGRYFKHNFFGGKTNKYETHFPKIVKNIIAGKKLDKYSAQIEYPVLFQSHNELCPHELQPEITPLMLACLFGNLNAIEFLIKAGAMLNRDDKNLKTAVYYATENENKNLIKPTLECLAKSEQLDVTVQDRNGNTPLHHILLRHNKYEWLKILINANVAEFEFDDLENKDYQTIVDCAIEKSNFEAIEFFRARYSKPAKDEEKITIIENQLSFK
ncbi:MAG: ankyrin repeat domain-containing protein, partial [Legionellales bacterium]|nr:ankyrin repeat domain-containing protein [Legionellales bacterium]